MPKSVQKVYFPEEFLELQKEIFYHEALVNILHKLPSNEIELKFGHIAAYCGIILDGIYDEPGLIKLAAICIKRLQEKRTGVAQLGTSTTPDKIVQDERPEDAPKIILH